MAVGFFIDGCRWSVHVCKVANLQKWGFASAPQPAGRAAWKASSMEMLSHLFPSLAEEKAQTDFGLMSCRTRPVMEPLQLLWNTPAIPHETRRSGHGRRCEACVTSQLLLEFNIHRISWYAPEQSGECAGTQRFKIKWYILQLLYTATVLPHGRMSLNRVYFTVRIQPLHSPLTGQALAPALASHAAP